MATGLKDTKIRDNGLTTTRARKTGHPGQSNKFDRGTPDLGENTSDSAETSAWSAPLRGTSTNSTSSSTGSLPFAITSPDGGHAARLHEYAHAGARPPPSAR